MLTQIEKDRASHVLKRAKEIIRYVGWSQFVASTRSGIGLCLSEAIREAAGMDITGRRLAFGAVGVVLMQDCRRWTSIAEWNDSAGRTVNDVYDLINQAHAFLNGVRK